MSIVKDCPELNYFRVVAISRGSYNTRVNYLVATLETSLGLLSLASMGHKDVREIVPIDKYSDNTIDNSFQKFGIYLAESSSYYRPNEIDRLKEDYFISKITGLKQGKT